MVVPGARACTLRCTEVMASTGTPGARDNRMIAEAIRDLEGKHIFARLELSANRRKLTFLFTTSFARAAQPLKGKKFAILDSSEIALLRSPAQVYFYVRAVAVQRSDHPLFWLPPLREDDWSAVKRGWLRAAAAVGERLGHSYVFVPMLDEFGERVAVVKVKIETPSSRWSPGRLYPRDCPEAVSVVGGGRWRTLTKEGLSERRNWTRVGPV